MQKNTNLCINLKTIMQEDALLNPGQCYRGVLSRTDEDQYLFEEAVSKSQHARRNPNYLTGSISALYTCRMASIKCTCGQ